MGDDRDPSTASVIEQLADLDLRKSLLKFAHWLAQSDAGAEDLLSEAILQVCDDDDKKGRPWDPSRASLSAHMRTVLRDLWRDKRRSAQGRRELLEPTFVLDESTVDPGPAPDEALSDARDLDRLKRWGALLRTALSKEHPRAVQVFDLGCEGVEDTAELAARLGCTTKDIYEANRQIARGAQRVRAAQEKAAAAQMRELRERSRKRQAP